MTDLAAPFTHSWIASVLGVTVAAAQRPLAFRRIWTDSRTCEPGDLFVALKGDIFDGHQYVDAAFERGALAALVIKGHRSSKGMLIAVDDTLTAYRSLAKAWREQFSIPVIAIAGSVGKTTTKEFTAALLSDTFRPVLKTEGSENGFIGIPKTLLRLRPETKAAVIEIGIDDIGAMEQHLQVVQPTAAILTAIAEEHLENLKDLPTVLQEERKVIDFVRAHNGTAVVNADDRHLIPILRSGAWSGVLAYGLEDHQGVTPQATGEIAGDSIRIELTNGENLVLSSLLPGNHNFSNLLGAATLANALGVSSPSLERGLLSFSPPKGRSHAVSHPSGMEFIFDYYNASPSSVRAALDLVHQRALETSKRTRVCLGDMLELGTSEESLHRGLAPVLIRHGIDRVWLFGPRMNHLHDELLKREFAGELRHFDSMEKMEQAFADSLPSEEVILVKGSRGMKMERLLTGVPPLTPGVGR